MNAAAKEAPPPAAAAPRTLGELLHQLTRREAHPTVQFLKYGIGGGIATGTHLLIFFAASLWLLPALVPDQNPDAWLLQFFGIDAPALAAGIQQRNFIINNGIAFIFSNIVAYLINFHWVFHPGRHKRHVEIILFLTISTISLAVGTSFGSLLIAWLNLSTTFAQIGNIIAAVLLNYVCRKFIVFKG